MVFDITIVNDLLWTFLAFATSASMCWTLFRKRDQKLDNRVTLMLFGMLIVWIGNFLVPIETYAGYTDMWISTGLILLGGLINIQILLEWKFGKYIWLKILSMSVAATLIIYGILNLI